MFVWERTEQKQASKETKKWRKKERKKETNKQTQTHEYTWTEILKAATVYLQLRQTFASIIYYIIARMKKVNE